MRMRPQKRSQMGASLHTVAWAPSDVQDLQGEGAKQGRAIGARGNTLAKWPSARQLWKLDTQLAIGGTVEHSSDHLGRVPRALPGADEPDGAEPGELGQEPWEDEELACADIGSGEGRRMF